MSTLPSLPFSVQTVMLLAASTVFATLEVITLCVFVPFAILYLDQPLKLDFLWAGLCLVGAVYFVFRTA